MSLSDLEAVVIYSVLEDCFDQLEILGGVIPNTAAPVDLDAKVYVEEDLLPRDQDFMFTVQTPEKALQKVQDERELLVTILKKTLQELLKTCSYTTLHKALQKIGERKKQEEEIMKGEKSCRDRMFHLQSNVELMKADSRKIVEKEDIKIAHLKDLMLETKKKCKSEQLFVAKLEEVRVAKNIEEYQRLEETLISKLKAVEARIEHEHRVTLEVESFLRDTHTHLTQQMKEWTRKYNQEVATKDMELSALEMARKSDLEALQNTKINLTNMKNYVKNYKDEKLRLQQEMELAEKQEKAAVKLQSWWRMMMVRNCLGPYRKKKSKAAKNAKN